MKELLANKKLIGVYILWFTLQLILLIMGWGTMDDSGKYYALQNFYPFTESSLSYSYDYTEFLIYTIVPVAIVVAITFLKSNPDHE